MHSNFLNHLVSLLTLKPGFNQRDENPLGVEQTVGSHKVAIHIVAINLQSFNYSGHTAEDVIGKDGGVRHDNPFHRGVADVALVPERHVSMATRPLYAADEKTAEISAEMGFFYEALQKNLSGPC